MRSLQIQNETAPLKAVILGIAQENGPIPKLVDAYIQNLESILRRALIP